MFYSIIVLLLFDCCLFVWDSCGVGNKVYLDKLDRCVLCIIEGRLIGVEELKLIFGWFSL